jgi:hypothetical protein
MAENEIFLNDTEKKFYKMTERAIVHINVGRLNPIPPPPPMLGNNYDVPNGLFGVGRDIFLRLAADRRNTDRNGQKMLVMGRKPYRWRNHWL